MPNLVEVNRDSEALIGPDELCQRAGTTLQNVYHLTHTKQIPFYKFGRKLRFKWSEVLQHFKDQNFQTK